MIVCIYMVISSGQSLSLSRGDGKGCVGGWYFRKLLWQISEITPSLNFSFLFFFSFSFVCFGACFSVICRPLLKSLSSWLMLRSWRKVIGRNALCHQMKMDNKVSEKLPCIRRVCSWTLLLLRPPRISGSLPDGWDKKPNNNPGNVPSVSWSHFLPSHSSYFVNKWMNERCWQKRPAGGAFRQSVHRHGFLKRRHLHSHCDFNNNFQLHWFARVPEICPLSWLCLVFCNTNLRPQQSGNYFEIWTIKQTTCRRALPCVNKQGRFNRP